MRMLLSTESILLVPLCFFFADAVYLLNETSFGQNNKIDSQNGVIANFQLLGSPKTPEVLSNKIILTPPTPGNARGAIWAVKPLTQNYWKVDVELRATGPERAGGNIQIWYVKDGLQNVGTASIYTVGNFDGLVLTIDQYAGSGGSIRAFLNDGTTNYKSHHNVDSLAFGHCEYSYRNLGRPSRITFSQINSGFYIFIDGKNCLASSNIFLPPGNNLGITAASAEIPDSIEIFKLVTNLDNPSNEKTPRYQDNSPQADQNFMKDSYHSSKADGKPASSQEPTMQPLDFKIQTLLEQVYKVQQAISGLQTQHSAQQQEFSDRLRLFEIRTKKIDLVSESLHEVKKDIILMKEELHKSLEQHVKGLRSDVVQTRKSVLNAHVSLHGRLSGLGNFVKFSFIIFGSQAILFIGYAVYKRKKSNKSKYI